MSTFKITFDNIKTVEFSNMNKAREAITICAKESGFSMRTVRSKINEALYMACTHHGAPRNQDPKEKKSVNKSLAIMINEDGFKLSSPEIIKQTRQKMSQKLGCPFIINAHTFVSAAERKWKVDFVSDEPHNHSMACNVYQYPMNRRLTDTQRITAVNMIKLFATNNAIVQYFKDIEDILTQSKDITNLR